MLRYLYHLERESDLGLVEEVNCRWDEVVFELVFKEIVVIMDCSHLVEKVIIQEGSGKPHAMPVLIDSVFY